jgi:hypothetical protein
MSQSAARAQRRHAARTPEMGLGGEVTQQAVLDTRATMHRARGVEPSEILAVEHVEVVGAGHQVMLTLDTPEGPRAFTLTNLDRAWAQRIYDLAEDTQVGLHVVRH